MMKTNLFKKIKGLFILIRPVNAIIGAISVFIAIYITKITPPFPETWYAMVSAILLMASGNAINDYFDYKVDAVHRKSRPIPSGLVTRRNALISSISAFLMAVFINLSLPRLNLYIIIICGILLFFYTPFLKRIPLIGNLVVAGISAAGFIYGAAVVHAPEKGIYPAIIAFFVHLTREIIKDAEDKEADLTEQIKTLPAILSTSMLHNLIAFFLLTTSLVVLYGYIGDFFNIRYFYVVIIFVIPLYIYFSYKFLSESDFNLRLYSKSSLAMKISMIFGIVAFYLGMK